MISCSHWGMFEVREMPITSGTGVVMNVTINCPPDKNYIGRPQRQVGQDFAKAMQVFCR